MLLKFVITDPHGMYEMLGRLIHKCRQFANGYGAEARFLFLGDYVDRGPDSSGVVALVRQLVEVEGAIALKGNHDDMMARALLTNDFADWNYNGMAACALSYGYRFDTSAEEAIRRMREDHGQIIEDAYWLDALPCSHEDDHRFFVHAGVNPAASLDAQVDHVMMWVREPFLLHNGTFAKHVVHGHTPFLGSPRYRNGLNTSNRTNLDTGAYYHGVMTAGVFDDSQAEPLAYIQVARDEI